MTDIFGRFLGDIRIYEDVNKILKIGESKTGVLPRPSGNWLVVLKTGDSLWLVKEKEVVYVASPFELEDERNKLGSISLKWPFGKFEKWGIHSDGTGYDYKPLVRPVDFGDLKERLKPENYLFPPPKRDSTQEWMQEIDSEIFRQLAASIDETTLRWKIDRLLEPGERKLKLPGESELS